MRMMCFCVMLLSASSCVKVKNCSRIVEGSYRIVSRSFEGGDSLFTIFHAKESDSALGIGIALNVEFFSYNSKSVFIFNMNSQGMDGVIDSVYKVVIKSPSKDLYPLINDEEVKPNYKMDYENRIHDSMKRYVSVSRSYLQTFAFKDLDNFINEYNLGQKLRTRDNLQREIFFWFDKNSNIKLSDLQNITFELFLSDGRVIKLKKNE